MGGVLQTIVSGLSIEDQISLVKDLLHYLEGQGIAPQKLLAQSS